MIIKLPRHSFETGLSSEIVILITLLNKKRKEKRREILSLFLLTLLTSRGEACGVQDEYLAVGEHDLLAMFAKSLDRRYWSCSS